MARRNADPRLLEGSLLALMNHAGYEPMRFREIRHALNCPKDQVDALKGIVSVLLEEGRIAKFSRDRFALPALDRKAKPARDQQAPSFLKPGRELPGAPAPREAKGGPKSKRRAERGEQEAPLERMAWKTVVARFTEANALPGPFSKPLIELADSFGEPKDEDFKGRWDLRDQEVYTIDPANAHDHDDAVGVTETDWGWLLDVHIADVSQYVTEGSKLDKAAVKRGFTTYLPWTAHTMMPQTLAATVCSLLAGRDRLALTCRIEVSRDGQLRKYEFAESVIRVAKFLSYEQAQEMADKGDPALNRLRACADALLARRRREYLIEFELPEARIAFSPEGEPMEGKPSERLPSHRWIEESMLAANRCCAHLLDEKVLPGLYRVHEPPEYEAIQAIGTWAAGLGLPVYRPNGARPDVAESNVRSDLQVYFAELIQRGDLPTALQGKIIRAMKKARYSADCRGHFALGWLHYAHFTSPIRRYPDLWTHRVIKNWLRGQEALSHWDTQAHRIGSWVSKREEEIMKIERTALKCCIAWILRDHIGETFEATVTGVEAFGMFLQIKNPWGEGMLHVSRMRDDYYQFDADRMELRGSRTRKAFKIGDTLQVILSKAEPLSGMVDFDLVPSEEEAGRREERGEGRGFGGAPGARGGREERGGHFAPRESAAGRPGPEKRGRGEGFTTFPGKAGAKGGAGKGGKSGRGEAPPARGAGAKAQAPGARGQGGEDERGARRPKARGWLRRR